MNPSTNQRTTPFARFNLTAQAYKELRDSHVELAKSQLATRSCDELPFFDWEAALLAKLLAENQDNVPLCGLVVAMIYCVCQGENGNSKEVLNLSSDSLACLGLSQKEFYELRVKHDVMNCAQPRVRSCDELPFFDWEAALLANLLAENQDNVPLCGLVVSLMDYVHQSVSKKARKAGPVRKDTIGMFYTTNQPLST